MVVVFRGDDDRKAGTSYSATEVPKPKADGNKVAKEFLSNVKTF